MWKRPGESSNPVLKAGTPIFEYDKGAWGPSEVEREFRPSEAGITRSHQTRKISARWPKPAYNAEDLLLRCLYDTGTGKPGGLMNATERLRRTRFGSGSRLALKELAALFP